MFRVELLRGLKFEKLNRNIPDWTLDGCYFYMVAQIDIFKCQKESSSVCKNMFFF